jgi:hypothetical protein
MFLTSLLFNSAWFYCKFNGDTLVDYLVKTICILAAVDDGLVSVRYFLNILLVMTDTQITVTNNL